MFVYSPENPRVQLKIGKTPDVDGLSAWKKTHSGDSGQNLSIKFHYSFGLQGSRFRNWHLLHERIG